jgi:hypothetical protein
MLPIFSFNFRQFLQRTTSVGLRVSGRNGGIRSYCAPPSVAMPVLKPESRVLIRDFWKLVNRPKLVHASTRAVGLDVHVAIGDELLDGGV